MTLQSIDPAVRAAQRIIDRYILYDKADITDVANIIRSAYVERTEEIKKDIERHCKEVFEATVRNERN